MTFQRLLDSLQLMNSSYAKLTELGRQKKEQLIANQVNELTQTLSQESKAIKSLTSADQARLQALADFQKEAGLKEDPGMRFESVIQHCASLSMKQALQKEIAEMNSRVEELKELNAANQLLVHQALDFVNLSLDLLVGSPEDEVVYQRPAQAMHPSKRNPYFDTRA